ncbi:cobalamin-binding protein [Sporosarcina pasteurii]|uniref:Vitamin B12-binding protein n=1 Tax=Sporosarcina pasteurii TaxID=1474 RepID=A0A380C6Q6_SPOPA|nr:cobalamin-binding protein [Sporosarcina pasteurii]MDS9471767.1 cobalamin-binding protein [Sporosarcina pasteurii]QBQ04636.1 cobalamin-binding protein [Sporosarcina pasteurii]SUJ13470.1 Vitamin B12-binding protein precursor [Sporosarcina pasteurii]
MRIISICPSNTELVAYLGLLDNLVAIDDYSDWPSEVQSLPKLGPDLSIDMDKLETFKPDLVLASLSVPGMEKNVEELQRREIPHIVLNPQSLNDIADDLLTVGIQCGIEHKALKRQRQYLAFIDEMKSRAVTAHTFPTLYWEWWPKPIFTPGKTNWLTEISAIAGGLNEFRDKTEANVQTDWNDLLDRNPDYILLAWVGVRTEKVNKEVVLKRPGWKNLSAIQNNYFTIMEEELYCRPSPRLLEGALKLGKYIHPEIYADLELPAWVTTVE